MTHHITTESDPPEFVLAWINQLLDPSFLAMLKVMPADRVDVRLSSSRGRVAKAPTVVVNGGQQEFYGLE